MNIRKLQKYKKASKVLTGMLAVTLSVGMMTDFSWKEAVSSIKNFGISMTAFAEDDPQGGTPAGSSNFDQELHELTTMVEWKYKDVDENCIYVKIKHQENIKQIEDEDEKERVKFEANTKEVVARYELKEGDKKFKIVDINGDYQWVDIDSVELDVSRAYKNENGDVIAIAMKTKDKKIMKVTYLDSSENPAEIEAINTTLGEDGNTSHPIKRYEVDKGTTGVFVYLEGEPVPCEVQLALDWKAPEVERLYKNASNTKMLIKAMDNESGIDKIEVDGRQITIQGTLRDITRILDSGVTEVKLYDAVGHETIVVAEEDATGPKVVIEKVENPDGTIAEDKYILKMRDHKSGLWKLESNGAANKLLKNYEDYPQTEERYDLDLTLDEMTDIKKICVYDALGNKAEIDLANITCVIVYTHSNLDGSKIAISLYEEGGESGRHIEKIGILNSAGECKIIELMPENTQRVVRCYETPAGTTGIRVFYDEDTNNEPADYVLDPYEVAPEVIGNRAVSLVGINRVEYSDGRKVEFNDSMPTSVKLTLAEGGSATIYDSLDNCSIVE